MDILHTISRYTSNLFRRKGATVGRQSITATEDVLWHTVSMFTRNLMDRRDQLVLQGGGGGAPSNALTLDGEALTLNGEILTLGA